MCNKEIKFKLFLETAKKLGADFIATGHYAQIKKTKDEFQLLKGKDSNKDQSYFLYTLKQEQLSQTLLPLGGLLKPQVRQLAKKYHLPNWDKKDSQGICFLGQVKLRDFLKTRIPVKQGNIVDTEGEIVGQHEGTAFYTIGQRQGLNIGGAGEPYYVVSKDAKTNTLVVSQKSTEKESAAETLLATEITWVGQPPKLPLSCSTKIRYRQPDQKVTIKLKNAKTLTVEFDQKQRAITPGQSVVFYQSQQVLGGGVIQQALT